MELKKHLVNYKIKIMKNNIFIKLILIAFIMSFYNCKSQIVVDMTSDAPLPSNYNETGNYYLKDINNYLNSFLGTWEYVDGNKKFQIILTKATKFHFVIPSMNIDIYEDGIFYKYKQFVNNNLVFESPTENSPTFNTENGIKIEGMIRDYGRVTKTVYYPQALGGGIALEGGWYFPAECTIEKLITAINEPEKITFDIYLRESRGFGEYDNPIYNGLPTFSIPNNIIMTKVP